MSIGDTLSLANQFTYYTKQLQSMVSKTFLLALVATLSSLALADIEIEEFLDTPVAILPYNARGNKDGSGAYWSLLYSGSNNVWNVVAQAKCQKENSKFTISKVGNQLVINSWEFGRYISVSVCISFSLKFNKRLQ